MFGSNLRDAQNVDCSRDVEDLSDRWRFLETPASKRTSQHSNLHMDGSRLIRAQSQNLSFAFNSRMLETDIEASPTEWISNLALLVRSQNNERNGLGFDSA